MCLSVVGMSFMKMFMAIDWKPFQYCYCLVFSYLCKPVLESMFSLFYIKKPIIYITILMGVVLVRTAPTAFHNVVVDDSA
jgi:hypothetical protein